MIMINFNLTKKDHPYKLLIKCQKIKDHQINLDNFYQKIVY